MTADEMLTMEPTDAPSDAPTDAPTAGGPTEPPAEPPTNPTPEPRADAAEQQPIDALPVTPSPVPPLSTLDAVNDDPKDDVRAKMIGQFTQWLDQTLAGEPPPRGLPDHLMAEATAMVARQVPSQESDLYTLFSALTALTGEIKLQGRAFKQLTDLLTPLAEVPAVLARLHESQLETAQGVQAVADARAAGGDEPEVDFKRTCDLMIDLYDRLQRGLQTCDDGIQSVRARGHGGWLARMLGFTDSIDKAVGSVQAIRDASGLAVARLQAALQEWGVQRIGKAGEPFDPERMTAVDVRTDAGVQPGTVLVVNRSGYAVHGTTKSTAQVTVSKA